VDAACVGDMKSKDGTENDTLRADYVDGSAAVSGNTPVTLVTFVLHPCNTFVTLI
jgi:hypothetical protein